MPSATLQTRTSLTGIAVVLLGFGIGSGADAQAVSAPMMNHAPVWSPHENSILFDSDRDGATHLYLIDPDEGTLRKLTAGSVQACCGQWTPDGAWIVFRSEREGVWQTLQMRPDGSAQRIVDESVYSSMSTSDDGAVLTLSVQDGRSVVVVVDSAGTPTSLTRDGWASQPSFSPDGRLIVYEERMGDDIGNSRIVVMDRNGAGRQVLERGTDPSWAPDGSLILLKTPSTRTGGYAWEVATVRPDGSLFTRLAPGVHPSWSPDGLRIAYMAETGAARTDLWVMNRDGTGKRCLTCTH